MATMLATNADKTFRFGCAFQFLPIVPLVLAAIFHADSTIVKTCFNLFAAFMVVAAVQALVWLLLNREAPKTRRTRMFLALAVNGLCPVFGYILMILAWKIP